MLEFCLSAMSVQTKSAACLYRLSLKAPRNCVAVIPQNDVSRHSDSGRSFSVVPGSASLIQSIPCDQTLSCERRDRVPGIGVRGLYAEYCPLVNRKGRSCVQRSGTTAFRRLPEDIR